MIGCGLAGSFSQLLAARCLTGVGSALQNTGAQLFLADISTPENRAQCLGTNQVPPGSVAFPVFFTRFARVKPFGRQSTSLQCTVTAGASAWAGVRLWLCSMQLCLPNMSFAWGLAHSATWRVSKRKAMSCAYVLWRYLPLASGRCSQLGVPACCFTAMTNPKPGRVDCRG
jgi:MFS family permease